AFLGGFVSLSSDGNPVTGETSLLSAADGCDEVHLAGRLHAFQQAERAYLAVHRHRDVGPQAITLEKALFDAGMGDLQVVYDLAHCRAGDLHLPLASGQIHKYGGNVDGSHQVRRSSSRELPRAPRDSSATGSSARRRRDGSRWQWPRAEERCWPRPRRARRMDDPGLEPPQ